MEMKLSNSDLQSLELTLYIPKIFRLRLWIGTRFIILGTKITGMKIKIEQKEEWDVQDDKGNAGVSKQ